MYIREVSSSALLSEPVQTYVSNVQSFSYRPTASNLLTQRVLFTNETALIHTMYSHTMYVCYVKYSNRRPFRRNIKHILYVSSYIIILLYPDIVPVCSKKTLQTPITAHLFN